MALIVTRHARERLAQRGLTVADVEWCIAGGERFEQANGASHYSRVYDEGRSEIHAIVAGDVLITCWIRGRLDADAAGG